MQTLRAVLAALLVTLALPAAVPAQDTSWPREVTFALLSTETAAEITRRTPRAILTTLTGATGGQRIVIAR